MLTELLGRRPTGPKLRDNELDSAAIKARFGWTDADLADARLYGFPSGTQRIYMNGDSPSMALVRTVAEVDEWRQHIVALARTLA
jgi:hypothetical protein